MLETLLPSELLALIGKYGILILILLYGIFCIIILLQIRGIAKLITFNANPLSGIILAAFTIHLLLVSMLFLLGIAIL